LCTSLGCELRNALLVLRLLSISVVWHELAHAFVARSSGMWVQQIVLQAFGGVTLWQGRASWGDRFWITAAGPFASALLCGLAFILLDALPISPNSFWAISLDGLYRLNLWLTVFNLLPIYPLDGGMMLQSVFASSLGSRFAPLVYPVGLVFAVILAVLAAIWSWYFVFGFALLFAWQNAQKWREEIPEKGVFGLFSEWLDWRDDSWRQRNRREIDETMRKAIQDGVQSLNSREKEILQRARQFKEWRN
jgi:Zn-dependent protease